MRITSIVLGLALAVGFGVASPLSSAFAQDAAPAASEKATFDESLLDIPDDESSEFYQKRFQDIQKGLASLNGDDQKQLEKLLPKLNDAMKVLQKKLAFADDLAASETFSFFRSYTLGAAREGKLDELREILKAEKAKEQPEKNRVDWLNYLVQCVSVDQAGKKDADALKAAIKELEEVMATEDAVAVRIDEYASIISQYNPEESAAFLQRALESFKKSENELRQRIAKSIEGKIRFEKLVGNEMVVEGLFLDKSEIDWSSYRGKVVLVDFWATWCGPCLGEIPNVEALYKKYHDAGFEVVGYSVDADLAKLEKFEEERKLPWKTASETLTRQANKDDGKEYEIISEYYGVTSIPTMVLVGKDGKVIDTNARGAHLRELLEKEFPEVK